MAILNYAALSGGRARGLRSVVTVLVGVALGISFSVIAYGPALRIFALGRPLYVSEVSEVFQSQVSFTFASALAGAVLGISTVAAARLTGRPNLTRWGAAFTGCFLVAATVAFVVALNRWNEAIASNQAALPGPSFASVPLLTPLIVGTGAVVVALILSVIWHRARGNRFSN